MVRSACASRGLNHRPGSSYLGAPGCRLRATQTLIRASQGRKPLPQRSVAVEGSTDSGT